MRNIYQLIYTGNDGSYNDEEYTGSEEELAAHIVYLEERGCHGIETYADGQQFWGFNVLEESA